jgi:squalene-hopene/tetraprenyl-beta-curcumene cyclase
MTRRKVPAIGCAVVLAGLALAACGAEGETTALVSHQPPAGPLPESLANEAKAAIDRGLDWLAAHQQAGGAWSQPDFPALSALPLWALAGSGASAHRAAADKAVKHILSCVQTNGGIYREVAGRKGGGLSNYNTAICMTALHAMKDPALAPVIRAARRFIAGAQHFGDDEYRGGFGYDRGTGRAYTDLLNTFYAVEAMRRTADVENRDAKPEERVDINWAETVKYIERMQNKPESGDENMGGFYYNPTDPKGGATTNRDGKVVFRSYGSITYAGLLALVYANLGRDDVRVKSALDWAQKHWTLEENPGMGQDALYFFYNVLSRCLDTAGLDVIQRKDGNAVRWREELAAKLIKLQKVDPKTGQGYWENASGRYWENDPVLVTAYSVLALQAAL